MHFCSIIIKHTQVSAKKAREIVGEELKKRRKADWYSVDGYGERTFGDKQTISLEKFKDIYKKEWLGEEYAKDKTMWDFAFVDYDEDYGIHLSHFVEKEEFWQFKSWYKPDLYGNLRERLVDLYYEAYKIYILNLIDDLLNEKREYYDYEVVLLDYHN